MALCACGCGQETPLSTRNRRSEGGPALGEPHRFVHGHQSRKQHTCTIDGCARPHRRNGLCAMHAQSARRSGIGRPCAVEGCARGEFATGYCALHYSRVRRSSEAGPVEPLHAPAGSNHVNERGYVYLYRPGHPLASVKGVVFEHRVVLFDAIGPGPHECFWCARPVAWERHRLGHVLLVVDHLDANPSNNARANLVPSCTGCNAHRTGPADDVAVERALVGVGG